MIAIISQSLTSAERITWTTANTRGDNNDIAGAIARAKGASQSTCYASAPTTPAA